MNDREQLQGYLAAIGTVAIWSGFIVISRLGGKSVLTPFDVLALRLGFAALLLLPFAGSLPPGSWTDARLWTLTLCGGVIYGVAVYSGFKFAPASHAGILLPGIQPFLIPLVGWLIMGTRAQRQQLQGLVAIGLGVLCVASPSILHGQWDPTVLLGDLLFLLASVAWAIYSVLAKRWGFSPWVLTRVLAIGSAALYLPIYAVFLPRNLEAAPLSTLILQGLYQGVGTTIVAMLLFLKAVATIGPARMGSMIALVPVLAGVAAAPLLDEPLTPELIAGLVLVSIGAFIAARPAAPTPVAA